MLEQLKLIPFWSIYQFIILVCFGLAGLFAVLNLFFSSVLLNDLMESYFLVTLFGSIPVWISVKLGLEDD